jgi:hypothetical protein
LLAHAKSGGPNSLASEGVVDQKLDGKKKDDLEDPEEGVY